MKAYLYVLNTLADWEIAYISAELYSGRFLKKTKGRIELVKIGKNTDPITSMGGMVISPDKTVDAVSFQEGDLLILPGADIWLEGNEEILGLVPELLKQNVIVAAICGATIALAKNGILNDRKHTSNDMGLLQMTCPEYSGADYYLEQPAVTDGNLITAGGLAPLEFSSEVFKKLVL